MLKCLTDEDVAKVTIENYGIPSGKAEGVDNSKLAPLFTKYLDLLGKVKITPIYDIRLTPPVIEVMNSGLQELLIGSVKPEELAKKIQDEYEKGS